MSLLAGCISGKLVQGRIQGGPGGPGPPTTKNEAPAPKFYKTDRTGQSRSGPPPDQILDPPLWLLLTKSMGKSINISTNVKVEKKRQNTIKVYKNYSQTNS